MNRKILNAALAFCAMPCLGFGALAQDTADMATAEPSIFQDFEIDRSDRMTVPVQVNGSTAVPFIVDPGAGWTVMVRKNPLCFSKSKKGMFRLMASSRTARRIAFEGCG